MARIAKFFQYARDRHEIYLRRQAGVHRYKLTEDPIFQKFRFTNVFRELDRTTAWFRKYVRHPMRKDPEVMLATTVFRMFNRVEVGEAVFCQQTLDRNNAFAIFCQTGDVRPMRKVIRDFCGDGPYVTGAYIITSPQGRSKLDGVLDILKTFWTNSEWREKAEYMQKSKTVNLQEAWLWYKTQPYFGKFHSYEIVTDLRWTSLLDQAEDIMTWCNVGPGARRGLNRIYELDKRDKTMGVAEMLSKMQFLLKCSGEKTYWPKDWPRWEMRDVEHTLCEFDKYERVRLGEGRPRGVFA